MHTCYNAYTRFIRAIMHIRNSFIHAVMHIRNSFIHSSLEPCEADSGRPEGDLGRSRRVLGGIVSKGFQSNLGEWNRRRKLSPGGSPGENSRQAFS